MTETPTERLSAPAQHVLAEIASQPDMWRAAAALATDRAAVLPRPGLRVAVVGCGTSWFIAQAYAAYREHAGHGETDAFAASEFPAGRRYDLVLAITRSGTTTEVLELLAGLPADQRTLIIVGDPDSPGATAADDAILLSFADEKSVVQTRFATSALALLRASIGHDLSAAIADCQAALAAPLPAGWRQKMHFTYLGHGPTVGLANEAALKMREAAIAWAESYPAYDYRHGPIAVAENHSMVWIFGEVPDGLEAQIVATGASVEHAEGDPMADLVRAQRLAIELALHRGYDPDAPRNLTRSIILES
jgi:fructoselysine-6-P-deglycase FrlB-like protein